jgi:hypothetical protein
VSGQAWRWVGYILGGAALVVVVLVLALALGVGPAVTP